MSVASTERARCIGRYRVLDRVASGGMAEVFRARVVQTDGQGPVVALKRVLDAYADDPAFVRMLVAEYQLSSLLDHPNIAAIYELLRAGDAYFIAMEYVDGKDLRSTALRLRERGAYFDVADAVYLMARALDGLHHAHTACSADGRPLQLVHRDFSPSNILLGYDGSVKLIDFGIAKSSVQKDKTQTGIIKGKVRYMSPEQANGDVRLTGQSDVFSAGSVLYELLGRAAAFSAPNEVELIYTVRRAEPRPLASLAPHVPSGLVQIVERAMTRARRERFADAAQFRDALVEFLRAFAPGYRRSRLANIVRTAWATEIDNELAALLSFVASEHDEAIPADDLLASASVGDSIDAASSMVAIPDADVVLEETATETLPARDPQLSSDATSSMRKPRT